MYGKLFSSMYDGTLASVGPWEALVVFQQLIILADIEGCVDMTPEAISRRTTIPLDIIHTGITALLAEDHASRSPAEGGRRIVPLSPAREWGWRIVNYQHYRKIRTADERREYMRNYQAVYRKQNKHEKPMQKQMQKYMQKNKKEELRTPIVPLQGTSEFDEFWKVYPRKIGKEAARKAWEKAKGKPAVGDILVAIEQQKQSEQWKKDGGQFIPHPATWLNQGRWADEPVESTGVHDPNGFLAGMKSFLERGT